MSLNDTVEEATTTYPPTYARIRSCPSDDGLPDHPVRKPKPRSADTTPYLAPYGVGMYQRGERPIVRRQAGPSEAIEDRAGTLDVSLACASVDERVERDERWGQSEVRHLVENLHGGKRTATTEDATESTHR